MLLHDGLSQPLCECLEHMSRRSKRNLKKSPASSPQPPPKPPDSVKEGTVHPTNPASSTVFAGFVGASPVKKPAISGLPADSGKGPLEDQAAVLEAMETGSGVADDASAKPLPEVTPEGRFGAVERGRGSGVSRKVPVTLW